MFYKDIKNLISNLKFSKCDSKGNEVNLLACLVAVFENCSRK